MTKYKRILALGLLANFLACAVHCQMNEKSWPLEKSFSMAANNLESQGSDSNSNHECKSCQSCEWVHSGGIYISNFDFNTDHAITATSWNPDFTGDNSLSNEVSLGVLTSAPPHLIKSWHFVFRTALPARAPSVLA